MHRFLERLDGAASTIVPLLYLVGLALGAASYFAGVTLAGENAGLAVGVALATAAELHSFLQQRRVRATWAQLQRLADDLAHAPERDALGLQLKVNAGILAALLAFSAFNATAFVAATWRPAPGFLPGWLQIGIRGLVIPALFFAAGFLAPLHTDASEQLRATSVDMLRRTLRAIGKQWKQRLALAQKRNADLAPIAIALLQDVGDTDGARRVQLIAAGLDATTALQGAGMALHAPMVEHTSQRFEASQQSPTEPSAGQQTASQAAPDTSIVANEQQKEPQEEPPSDRPPTGGGSPAVASKLPHKMGSNVTPLRRGMGKAPRRDKRATSRANAKSGKRGTVEQRIRAALASDPTMTHTELVHQTGVSDSSASKYMRLLEAEQRASDEQRAAR